MGLEKNTKPMEVEVGGKKIRTIPDAMKNGKQTVEIKNVKSQSKTSQLKAQEKISKDNGVRPILRINKGAQISKPVIESFEIQYYNTVPVVPADMLRLAPQPTPMETPKKSEDEAEAN